MKPDIWEVRQSPAQKPIYVITSSCNLSRWGSERRYWNGEKFGFRDEAIITESLSEAEHILDRIDSQFIKSPDCFTGDHSVKIQIYYTFE